MSLVMTCIAQNSTTNPRMLPTTASTNPSVTNCRSNRAPHGNFALPGFRADQQQARYIHARDQQQ
jgi:hypothetical protein